MRRALVLAFVALLPSCASAAYRAAKDGDLGRLKTEIADQHARGGLDDGDAADLARAVAGPEIATAKKDEDALARLRETRACAAELDGALADRAKVRDAAGAEAALTRLEDGRMSEGAARGLASDADDRWRAVGVRALVRDSDREARQAALVDASPRVRRSAIRASGEAKDVGDLDVLFETARLDPELLLRNEALRASSAILRGAGDTATPRAAQLVGRLRDLWTVGDDALREDVSVAWALAPVFESGGREALRVTIAEGKGPGAIAAAGVVLRTASRDEELVRSSSALLSRTIEEGSRRDRLHAISVARVEGAQLEALRKAAKDGDLDVQVPALSRLLESAKDRKASIAALEAVAGLGVRGGPPVEDPRTLAHAARARHALASGGHLRVQAWIEQDLASPDPARRLGAASALAALGRPARAAPLLADPDPGVRARAACTMIMGARR